MEKTIYSSLCLALVLLTGCSGKTEAYLENLSQNGKVKLSITAKRSTPIESWKVDMRVKAYDFKEGALTFEIYADDLNAENVDFDWRDENNLFISITQNSGSVRLFHLIASPNQVQMAEIPNGG